MMWTSRATVRTTAWLLFLNVLMVPLVLRQREFGSESVDFQILLKLGLWAASLAFSLAFVRLWGHRLIRHGNAAYLPIFLLMIASCAWSPSFVYSAGSVLSVIAVVSICALAAEILPEARLLRIVITAIAVLSFLSIVVYYAAPAIGRMAEWHGNSRIPGKRLAGVLGTANIAGYVAGFGLLLLYLLRVRIGEPIGRFWIACAALDTVALLMSNSRTAIAALFVSIALIRLAKITYLRVSLLLLAAGIGVIVLVSLNYDALFAMLARSGDASEITSGTGRNEIWRLAFDYIHRRPWHGWGYGSTPFVLRQFDATLGFSVTHTHNAFIQAWFSLGIFGLISFLLFTVAVFIDAIAQRDLTRLHLLLYLYLTSFTESSVFQGVATMPTVVLGLAIGLARYAPVPRIRSSMTNAGEPALEHAGTLRTAT